MSEQPEKPKPLVRLVGALMSYHLLFSVVGYLAGLCLLVALPHLAKQTYFSENALLPGSSLPKYGRDHAMQVRRDMAELQKIHREQKSDSMQDTVRLWLQKDLQSLGIEVYSQRFEAKGSAVQADSTSNSMSELSTNLFAIVRSQRGDGTEGLVLVTPIGGEEDAASGLAAALGLSIVRYLASVPWLARDVVWLIPERQPRLGDHAGVAAWLREYHAPEDEDGRAGNTTAHSPFGRAGLLIAALVLDVEHSDYNSLVLALEGDHAMLPNLDLVNTVQYLASRREHLPVTLAAHPEPAHLTPYARSLNVLTHFVLRQGMGVPTGAHGAFKRYSVEALTIKTWRASNTNSFAMDPVSQVEKLGRVLEGSIRVCNNILEKFHQSFFLYLLVATDRFVPIEMYMPALGLCAFGLPVTAAALVVYGDRPHPSMVQTLRKWVKRKAMSEQPKPEMQAKESLSANVNHSWTAAACVILLVYMWAALCGAGLLLPSPVHWQHYSQRITVTWLIACAAIMFPMGMAISVCVKWVDGARAAATSPSTIQATNDVSGPKQTAQVNTVAPLWVTVKALLLCSQALGVAALGCFNFSLAILGTLLVSPMCLAACPCAIIPTVESAHGLSFVLQRVVRWGLVVGLSPPVVMIAVCISNHTGPDEFIARFLDMQMRW
eukprot:CAMPEP_0114231826 /NCGR_PEP_ID=MMETSP0058-20121206/4266_1 /TAXON_ID=36894 /ORGANISM="Pyramimonas parkeae, CCMP726" /LENGTH=661 /DNA_ID=CAMNT_0001343231 /DNA_START=69 /DNA_END=2051 /DNA_ORIENTATION=+